MLLADLRGHASGDKTGHGQQRKRDRGGITRGGDLLCGLGGRGRGQP